MVSLLYDIVMLFLVFLITYCGCGTFFALTSSLSKGFQCSGFYK